MAFGPSQAKHITTDHSFAPLDVSDNNHLPESNPAGSHWPAGQNGTVCSSCRRYIDDVQHRCIECTYFALCHKCVSSVQTRELHDVSHHIFPVDIVSGDGMFTEISKLIHWFKSQYQGCKSQYQGCRGANMDLKQRYRCLSCPDFTFCNNCIGDPTVRFEHDVSHCFLPVALPEGRNSISQAAHPRPHGLEIDTAVGHVMVPEIPSSLPHVS